MTSRWNINRFVGLVLYDFEADGQFQLAVKAGQKVMVLKESSGWYKGHAYGDPSNSGIFPVSFIEVTDDEFDGNYEKITVPTAQSQAALQAIDTGDAKINVTKDAVKKDSPKKEEASDSKASKAESTADTSASAKEEKEEKEEKRQLKVLVQLSEESEADGVAADQYSLRVLRSHSILAPEEITNSRLMSAIRKTLAEYNAELQKCMENADMEKYHNTMERMSGLVFLRRLFMAAEGMAKTAHADQIVQLIESSRCLNEKFLTYKDETEVADSLNTGIITLKNQHTTLYSEIQTQGEQWKMVLQNRAQDLCVSTSYPDKMHIFLDIKAILFKLGEPFTLNIMLYKSATEDFITEDFTTDFTELGMPEDLSLLGKLYVVFENLTEEDLDELYLVMRVYRRGNLQEEKDAKKRKMNLRRPYGCAAMSLSDLMLHTKLEEEINPAGQSLQVYQCAAEKDFINLHKAIIAGEKVEEAPMSKGIAAGITMFGGNLDELRKSVDNLDPKITPGAKKLMIPKDLHPGVERDDLYIKFINGSFLKDKKSTGKNVQVKVRVVMDDGTEVPDCIMRGCGKTQKLTEYCSVITYHSNTPDFGDFIKLTVDRQILHKCHLLFTFKHASNKAKKGNTFAYAVHKLTHGAGQVIPQGFHTMNTSKPFNNCEDDTMGAFYLKKKDEEKEAETRKETFQIQLRMCSTKLTHHADLHRLFYRNLVGKTELLQGLKGLARETNHDVLSYYMREIFDNLFEILDGQEKSSEIEQAAFVALSNVLYILSDHKLGYQNKLNQYINEVFNNPKIYSIVLERIRATFKSFNEPTNTLKTCSKIFIHLLKFVVSSRRADLQANPDSDNEDFKKQLNELLPAIFVLVGEKVQTGDPTYVVLHPAQAYLVRSFSEVIDLLESSQTFQLDELAEITKSFLSAIPQLKHREQDKLQLMRQLLLGPLGTPACAGIRILLPLYVKDLVFFMDEALHVRNDLSLIYLILAVLLPLFTSIDRNKHDEWMECMCALLQSIIEMAARVNSPRQQGGEHSGDESDRQTLKEASERVVSAVDVNLKADSITVVWALIGYLSEEKFTKYLGNLTHEDLSGLLKNLATITAFVLTHNTFPQSWLLFNFSIVMCIKKMMLTVAPVIQEHFLQDVEVTREFILGGFIVNGSPHIALETLAPAQSELILTRHGDVRLCMCKVIREVWDKLDNEMKLALMNSLKSSVFQALDGPLPEQRDLGISLIYDSLVAEWATHKRCHDSELNAVDALYQRISNAQHKEMAGIYPAIEEIKARTTAHEDPEFVKTADSVLALIKKMYGMMRRLLELPQTSAYEDERTHFAIKIMTYLESIPHIRKDIFARYADFLVDVHCLSKNHVEAGMAQLLHLKVLSFSDNLIGPVGKNAEEKERIIKEKIHKSAMRYFVAGRDYERAIAQSEILRTYYGKQCYNFTKLSAQLREEAHYYVQSVSIERSQHVYATYYAVRYKGASFDKEIKDKLFVCKGGSKADFIARLTRKYPKATIDQTSYLSPEIIEEGDEESAMIIVNQLEIPPEHESLAIAEDHSKRVANTIDESWRMAKPRAPSDNPLVPFALQRYHDNDELKVFYNDVIEERKHQKTKNPSESCWLKRTIVITTETFPSSKRRMNVAEAIPRELNPIQVAIERIQKETKKLNIALATLNVKPSNVEIAGSISRVLAAAIDEYNGGVFNPYIKAFGSPVYLRIHTEPIFADWQKQMREELEAHYGVVEKGLRIFHQKVKDFSQLVALHENMDGQMAAIKKAVANVGAKTS